ncbi:hypothetical protein PTTG_02917 [Puccinia triticina 1-1 BBBD Race 1]|uniref:Uncharacterized protein n=1 Tax=Puccinia triticina (isolate 1-1 / race 1 (BBBD)) TaxID=630390 RepID=A0A180G3U5_PUCT1|nr:hypothetical protein PTTG_02917 [Puccinia triticina 1-1 BBBD Race 1]WAR52349.1 hypothetical protein PtB15_1B790 [Puccinia triticina]
MSILFSLFIVANLACFPSVAGQTGATTAGPSASLTTALPGGSNTLTTSNALSSTNTLATTNTGTSTANLGTANNALGTATNALGTTTTQSTGSSGNGSPGGTKQPDTGSYYSCSQAFAPLDEDQTLLFDRPVPEAAAYCKSQDSEDHLACALRSCIGFTTCSTCSIVTSSADDPQVTTDGKVIPTGQNCEIAYHRSPKAGEPSLCLTAALNVLQCKGNCDKATSCGTCFKVTETSDQTKSAAS